MKTSYSTFCLGLLLLGSSSFAQSSLIDINYLPAQGQSLLLGALVSLSGEVEQTQGANSATIDTSAAAIAVGYQYGLFENGSFLITLNNTTQKNEYPSGASAEAKGFDDPTFSYQHRFLSATEGGIILDGLVTLQPSLFKSKSATATQDGTAADGSTNLKVGVGIGNESEKVGWRAELDGTYYFEGKTEDQSTGTDDTTDAFFVPSVKVEGNYKIMPSFAVGASLEFTFVPEIKITDGANDVAKIGEGTNTSISLNGKFLPAENFYIELELVGMSGEKRKLTSTAATTYNSESSNGGIALSAGYLF